MEFALKILLAYLLGSIVGSLVVGRLWGGVDIRKSGSGNAGATNALRTQGPAFALWVIFIDVAKGWIAAAVLPTLALPRVPAAPADLALWLPPACAFAAVVGHVFPVWHGFRGGKGVATLVGAFAGIELLLLVPLFATWLAIVAVSGFVGLASISAALAIPVYLLLRDGTAFTPAMGFALACAALVVYTHRANVRRMRAGTEPRARRLWLLGRGRT
ncbi:MAG TPA: glycerol-3-phosphate 1-O-acyltransferase PlsY [Steroidobacteraceae bacterium]|jgi:glycerol-3-phosphate acyltransferase PlsY|nr:glycerol-3-phosphate 1-O-acyltransferase PlsY [Steroidobacteraceae bacterium]